MEFYILEHVLQPIAFTEQAAAISERDPVMFVCSEEEYRAVIAKGRTYSGVDYMRATHRRMTLRGRFGDLFLPGGRADHTDGRGDGLRRRCDRCR